MEIFVTEDWQTLLEELQLFTKITKLMLHEE